MKIFHAGERAVQAREGVAEQARRLAGMIGDTIPVAARDFLGRQRMIAIASVDEGSGRVWCSLLTGPPGFAQAPDEKTLDLRAWPEPGDPLAEVLRPGGGGPVGVLAIELATRRRMKLKGRASALPGGAGLRVTPDRVYSLCPKYIQAREPIDAPAAPAATLVGGELSVGQRRWIARADTAVIATASEAGGPDASHRGGAPGFVRVASASRVEIPDYAGNNIFNTLGNLDLDDHAGLLFVDFDTGRTLQLTGRARVTWSAERRALHAGAQRVIDFTVEQVIEIQPSRPLRWRFLEASRFNPM